MVVGGGDGVGRIQQVAEAVGQGLATLKASTGATLIVICGKNEKVRRNLKNVTWPVGVHAEIKGFVQNMDEWMAASNVMVTKAGPGTIAECCTRNLPVVLSSYLPGQERGNVTFAVEGGFGEYTTKPDIIAQTVVAWLQDPVELEKRSKAAGAASRPRATLQIAEEIGRKWLKTSAADLASALLVKLRQSEQQDSSAAEESEDAEEVVHQAEKAEDTSKTESLNSALTQLNDAYRTLRQAQLSLREAKMHVRSTLEEAVAVGNGPADPGAEMSAAADALPART